MLTSDLLEWPYDKTLINIRRRFILLPSGENSSQHSARPQERLSPGTPPKVDAPFRMTVSVRSSVSSSCRVTKGSANEITQLNNMIMLIRASRQPSRDWPFDSYSATAWSKLRRKVDCMVLLDNWSAEYENFLFRGWWPSARAFLNGFCPLNENVKEIQMSFDERGNTEVLWGIW